MEILASAYSVPATRIENDQLRQYMDTSDDWIKERTGIKARHVVTNQKNFDLAYDVAQQLLAKAQVAADQLGFIIVATMSPDYATPAEANRLQAALQADHAFAFNINVACAGFEYALHVADRLMTSPTVHQGIVIGSEVLSRLVDWHDRRTAVLFADGAGGVLINDQGFPVQAVDLKSFGDTEMALVAGEQTNHSPFAEAPSAKPSPFFKMNGRAVYQFAISEVPRSINRALTQAAVAVDDVDWYLLHQANARIVQSVTKKLKADPAKFPINIDEHGNTSAASVPILLAQLAEDGRLQRGQRLVLSGFGGGLSVGSLIVTY